jgi:hypothetical protein
MPDRERGWPWTVAGYALLLAVVAAAAGFVYDSAAPAHRPVVIRLAVAIVLAVVLIHLRSHFRGDPRGDPPSPFEDALVRQPAAPEVDPGFAKLATKWRTASPVALISATSCGHASALWRKRVVLRPR